MEGSVGGVEGRGYAQLYGSNGVGAPADSSARMSAALKAVSYTRRSSICTWAREAVTAVSRGREKR